MTEALWLAGLLFANLWAVGGLDSPNTKKDALAGGTGLGAIADKPVDGAPIVMDSPLCVIRPTLKRGEKPCCDQPPSTAEVLRALPKTTSMPYVYTENRDVLEVVVEKVADKVDAAPRFYPLIGSAQMHHCRWKCTVHFNRVIETSHPFPFRVFDRCAEVVYVEKDALYVADLPNEGTTETSEPPVNCPGGHNKTATGSPKTVPARPVAASNLRKSIHVIVDDGGELGQRVSALPADEQTVLDAVGSTKVAADKVRKVRVSRISTDGRDGFVELPVDWKALTRDGQTASNYQLEPGDRVHVYVEPVSTPRAAAMTLDDVVRMSKAGVTAKVIERHMEQTGAVFNLSTDDILYLRKEGVSNRVIGVMQERREKQNTSSSGNVGSIIVGGLLGTGVGAIVANNCEPTDYNLFASEKELTVVVMSSFKEPQLQEDIRRADLELADQVLRHLRQRCEQNKHKLKLIPLAQVRSYQLKQVSSDGDTDAVNMGRHFKADYVLQMEIQSMSLYEKLCYPKMFRGRTEANIALYKVTLKDGEDDHLVCEKTYRAEYPGSKGPIPADSVSTSQFRLLLLDKAGREITRMFIAYPQDEKRNHID